MKKKKIWIVTELFYPEETAVAYIFTRIAKHLSENYKVGVICGPEFYDNNKIAFSDDVHISNEIEIYRTRSLNLDKNSLIQRTVKIIILSLRMGVLMRKKISKGETVLLATNPAPLLLFTRVIKHFKKFQLHILVHDVFPENAIAAKIFKNNRSITYKAIKFLFDNAYAHSEHLMVIGRDMKEIMTGKVNRVKTKPTISIITNWSNPDKILPIAGRTNTDKTIVLQYAGNIGRNQGLSEILDAFRLSNNKNLFLNIRGTGALYAHIGNYLKSYQLENVSLKGSYSRNEENEILANCDIGIVSLSHGMFGLGVPSKTYHLLSAGKPILFIGDLKSEISQLVIENKIGWALDITNQNEIIDFFNRLTSIDDDILIKMGEKARYLAENEYNEPHILNLMQSKIESIINNQYN